MNGNPIKFLQIKGIVVQSDDTLSIHLDRGEAIEW